MSKLYYLQLPRRTPQFQAPAMQAWESADAVVAQMQAFIRGVLADGSLNEAEAGALCGLLRERKSAIDSIGFPLVDLARRVEAAAADGVFTEEELSELRDQLQAFVSAPKENEPARSAIGCFDDPAPAIVYPEQEFVVTGQFAWGTRNQIIQAIEARGGVPHERIRRSTRYIVVGAFVSGGWAHGNYGRKIEGAIELRKSGVPLAIVSEAHWVSSVG
ncbi:MAG: hypothetical protein ACAH88_02495 [Roseimicrobium sp.]